MIAAESIINVYAGVPLMTVNISKRKIKLLAESVFFHNNVHCKFNNTLPFV